MYQTAENEFEISFVDADGGVSTFAHDTGPMSRDAAIKELREMNIFSENDIQAMLLDTKERFETGQS